MEYDTRRRRRRRRREENSVGRSTCARGGTSVSSELPDVFSTLAVAFRFIRALCAFDLAIARHVLRLLRPPPSLFLLLSSLSPNPSSSRSHDSLIFSPRLARCAVCTSMHRARNNRRTKDTRRGKRGRASSFSSFFSFFLSFPFLSLSCTHTHIRSHSSLEEVSRSGGVVARDVIPSFPLFVRNRAKLIIIITRRNEILR